MKKNSLFSDIELFIKSLHPSTISKERKATLQPLIDFIQVKVTHQEAISLNFICTHNSRRSHLSQVWAQTMAAFFGIENVFCYSGGTEATALFPMAAKTLQNSGFQIQTLSDGKNPVYAIKYAENAHPIMGFSKRLDDDFNPKTDFAAIMTCNSANEACPLVLVQKNEFRLLLKIQKLLTIHHNKRKNIMKEVCKLPLNSYTFFLN